MLFAVFTGHKVEEALDFDLDDRLDDGWVAEDEELAKDVGSAEHDIEVVTWGDIRDVPGGSRNSFLGFR